MQATEELTPQREKMMDFKYKSGSRPLAGYTIHRGLGTGGFGEVYFATSDGGKEVALKLIRRNLDVELRGVKQCLNLKHPNLLSIFDVRESDDGETWIIMEYIAGPSLLQRLEASPRGLPPDEVFAWLKDIAAALDYLHQCGVVHRDLKPGNIVRETGMVKVSDYGLSKFIAAGRKSGQTQSIGTVHYMAPEIATGKYGKGVDVYAAAIVAYEMLTGEVPFDGETAGEILMKHLTSAPDLSRVDATLRPIFERALAKEPDDRTPSVGAFVAALQAAMTGAPVPAEAVFAGGEAKSTPSGQPKVPPQAKPQPNRLELEGMELAAKKNHAARQRWGASIPPPPGTVKALRRSISDTLWTFFMAGLLSMILPILVMTAMWFLRRSVPEVDSYVSLSVVTGLASWVVLACSCIWSNTPPDGSVRRLQLLLLGLVLGAVALMLNIWLGSIPTLRGSLTWEELATAPELRRTLAPLVMVYVTLFGLMLVIPNWYDYACRTRRDKFALHRVIWPGLVALVLATILGPGPEPFWLAAVFAMTAMIVQWLSPHEPRRPRFRFGGWE